MHRRITGKLVIATHNPGKLVEMRELLAPYGIEAMTAGELFLPEPEETGDSFRANARIKAMAAAKAAKLPAFADDSGLVVDALDGAPGIYSARWAGETKDFSAAMARIERCCRSAAQPRPTGARRISCRRCAWHGLTTISRRSRPSSTARWYGRRAAPPASAMTRRFCRTGTRAHSAR